MLIVRSSLILMISWSLFMGPTAAMPVYAQVQPTSQQIVKAGINYLLANYNATVGLVRNSPDNASLRKTYYVYSDNYLTSVTFWSFDPSNTTLTSVADNINITATIYLRGQPDIANQYEALTSNVAAFEGSQNVPLSPPGQETVLTTVNSNTTSPLPANQFADIAFLEAVHYYQQYQNEGNSSALTLAKEAYSNGSATFDGIGFADKPFTSNESTSYHQYQTYKLALYIYATKLLGYSYPQSALDQLVSMSATSGADAGGFYTCYGSDSKPACGTNAESTALAVLAMIGPPLVGSPFATPEFSSTSFALVMFVAVAIVALTIRISTRVQHDGDRRSIRT